MSGTTQDRLATLHWDPEIGFELDIELSEDDVSVRMIRVPVPADGTTALREPVELYALDTLFKSQVDVAGAPGQLDEVKVQLDGDGLRMTCVVEDAETGDTRALDVRLPLKSDGEAPESGGPVPHQPDEDELDWEDEETLERMFDGAPESTAADEREDEEDEDDESGDKLGGKGLAALLKALMDPDLDAKTQNLPDDTPATAPPREPVEPPPPPAPPTAPPSAPGLMSADQEARSFLELLLGRDDLELTEDGTIDDLVPGTAQILQLPLPPGRKAGKLANWLLDQDAVEELYIDDDSLETLLDQW